VPKRAHRRQDGHLLAAEALESRLLFSTIPVVLATFSGSVQTASIAVDSSGNIFGTTLDGGHAKVGTIWELAKGSNTINTLYSFNGPTDGFFPSGIAVDGGDNLYGITLDGGYASPSAGSVWELPEGGTTINTLYNFPTIPVNGAFMYPDAITIDSSGNLYGTADNVGSAVSTVNEVCFVWEIPKGSDTPITLFTLSNDVYLNGITVDGAGTLFGTNQSGGPTGDGSIWELDSGASTPTTVFSFDGTNGDGTRPFSITSNAAGNLYGAASSGWELSSENRLFTRFSSMGVYFAMGNDGNLYGLTVDSGPSTGPAVIELTPLASSTLAPAIAGSTLPDSGVAGLPMRGRIIVNLTNSVAVSPGQTTVSVFASGNGIIDDQSVLLGEATKSNIRLNAKVTVSTPTFLLPQNPNVTYSLFAEVIDRTGAASVSIAGPTVAVVAPFVQPSVAVGAATPVSIAIGKSGSVLITVINNGNVPASGVDVILNPSADGISPMAGVILASIHSSAKIRPTKSKTFRLHFKATSALQAGSYFPFVSVSLGGVSMTVIGTTLFSVG
jgi:hypothetical protein